MKIRTLLALALLLMPSLMFALQKQERLYVYGVATSFNDSTVYITEIQQLDSAWVDTKTGFLYSRNNYSFQLRDHLKANGFATPTCVTYFAKTRKEIEKKYVAIKKRYATRGHYNVKYVTKHDFTYSCLVPDDSERSDLQTKKAKKK